MASTATAAAAAAKDDVEKENREMMYDDDYEVPRLDRREDINANFPVVVRTLDSKDGIKRFGLEWDRRSYHPFHASKSTSWDCYNDFNYYSVWRLIYALRQRPDLYTIEPPRTESELCIIAMTPAPESEAVIRSTQMFMLSRGVQIPAIPPEPPGFNEGHSARIAMAGHTPAPPSPASPPPASPPPPAPASHALPVLRTLNELKAHFPVVWKHDTERNLYLLDIFGKKLKDDAERRAGHPLSARELEAERRRIERDLSDALRASDAWDAYGPKGSNQHHFAVLAMKRSPRG